VGVGEALGVAVGGVQRQDDRRSGRDGPPAQLDVLQGDPHERPGHAQVAQQLLDRVNVLVDHGYARRERDPRRRRDVYVVDDDAWYHPIVVGARRTLASARAATAAAHTYGIDTPVGRRMARAGAFLRRVGLDLWDSADRWRDLPARPS
jgi:hypothetical protein